MTKPTCLHVTALWVSLLVLFGAGCGASKQIGTNDSLANSAEGMHCLYLLDEKYAEDQQGTDPSNWIESVLQNAIVPESPVGHYDLFSHQGGGPLGAEWNSDGSIFLLLVTDFSPEELGEAEVRLNGKIYPAKMKKRQNANGTALYLSIPPADWLDALKPIKKSDYTLIYGSKDILDHSGQEGSQLGVGRILKVQIEMDYHKSEGDVRMSFLKAFHRAVGE